MIGFTCGTYDLFHAGHNILLRDCRSQCDKLIVGLHTDPTIDRKEKNKPVQSVFERWIQLKNCSWVDEIIPYETETDLLNLLATTEINKRFLGEEFYACKKNALFFLSRSWCIYRESNDILTLGSR